MRIFRYRCDLPAEVVLDRFERFAATEIHNPFNPFQSFYNPRVGLHTRRNGNEINGYYESGVRNRHDSLQSLKVWFEFTVKPREEGCTISCTIFSSPYFVLIALIMIAAGIRESFTSPVGAAFMLGLSAIFLVFEARDQISVRDQILALAPKATPQKRKNSKG